MKAGPRSHRFAVLGLVLAVFTSACTDTSGTSTTGASVVDGSTTTPGSVTSSTVDPRLDEPLPVDPDVTRGVLDNGLTYYIKRNDSPGGRAELRLVVDAGSVQEEHDQAGTAHFLEHMMFNGTERFPRNELIAVLEAFGPRFGPDINAYTSFDETVYELALPTEDPELVQLGVDVLREWASRATLAEDDVVAERGVVVDEWRLRAQGYSGRVGDLFQQLILPGTRYDGHLPIGSEASIRATTPDVLARFYRDWYQPERMAVVAVGDFDPDNMEEMIIDAFTDLESDGSAPNFDPINYEPPAEPRASGMDDEESAGASVSVFWPSTAGPMTTVGDLRSAVAANLAFEMVANRLNDEALRGNSDLLSATGLEFAFTRHIRLRGVDVTTQPEDLESALETLLIEVRRVAVHGLTDSEVDRAITRFRTASEQVRDQQGSIQDVEIADQIVEHFLSGAPLMTPDQAFEVESVIADGLTRADFELAFGEVTAAAPLILALGPDDVPVPSSDELLAVGERVAGMTVTPPKDDTDGMETLMATPEPVPAISREQDSQFGYTTLEFENGATVYLWESDIAADGVFASAVSFGGTSQVEVEDLPEAFLMIDILSRSGLGPADVPTLQRFLTDRLVVVSPWISETREGFVGSAASDDVETLLQMLHLYMTAPRFDEVALAAVLGEVATVNDSRDDLPDILVEEALNLGYYGDDPRYFAFPTPEQMADFESETVEQVYEERFGSAGDFAFAFVGDFETDDMVELAERYIGSLPGTPEREAFVDHQPLPPREVQVITVEAGADPQGRVSMFFTNEFEATPRDRVTASLLDLIVNVRLRDRIREEMSATYSVVAGTDLQRDPDPFAESFVTASGDPVDLERISAAVLSELGDLGVNGPSQQEMLTAAAQLGAELDLIDNGTLADALLESYLYPDQPVSDLATRVRLVDQISADEVQELAGVAFNQRQRIEVRVVPRS